ncbi:unnamed protein product [Periconia digitata]|uniref:Uncharacterized protein n=1 Tax=Periconia digitata TaxID=1303443 RepID=A0A9W4U143_9PLEO|nr:unnamed protein product [Periconia digitata]
MKQTPASSPETMVRQTHLSPSQASTAPPLTQPTSTITEIGSRTSYIVRYRTINLRSYSLSAHVQRLISLPFRC